MIPGAAVMLFCVALLLIGARYRREELLLCPGKKDPLWLFSAGLFLKERLLRDRLQTREEKEQEQALLMERSQVLKEHGKRYAAVLLFLFFGGACAFLAGFFRIQKEDVTALTRPAFGEVRVFNVRVEGLAEEEELAVPVSGQDPEPEAMDRVFDATYEEVLETVLNGNPSFQEVTRNLLFPKEAANGIRLSFESSDPLLLSDYGTVFSEEVGEEGQPVILTVTLRYKEQEKSYRQLLLIKKEAQPVLSEKEKLETLLQEKDLYSAGEPELKLPESFEGKTLRFQEATASPLLLLFLALLLAMLTLILPKEKTRRAYKRRCEALENAYPKLLLKLETLISAGLSIRSAFLRITMEYERKRKEGAKKEYVYEEMRITARELAEGTSEGRAYQEFGRRIGLHCYVKLGSMLSQSVRQGISGLSANFEEEMAHAMEQKRNNALKKGEEAGTKILFPMMLMLAVVIASLVVPALMSL